MDLKAISVSVAVLIITIFLFAYLSATQDGKEKNGIYGNRSQTTVVMENAAYNPQSITISKGTTVMWINQDSFAHTVTMRGVFESGTIPPHGTFTFTFNQPGTYDYFCTLHPSMLGTIIVQ